MKFNRILVTNDDGIGAEGIKLLTGMLSAVARVYVVAPELERSAMGHAITMHKPLHATPVEIEGATQAWRINGTPADCAKLGVEALLPTRPDLLLSGINHGSNLGRDIYYSGTVSAAMEGMFLGVPSMALSYAGDDREGLEWSARFVRWWVTQSKFIQPPNGMLYNVNFPQWNHQPPHQMVWVRLGQRRYSNDFHKRIDPRGRAYYWMAGRPHDAIQETDTDVGALAGGMITVTPLQMDATAYPFIADKEALPIPSQLGEGLWP
ncbi:5'/3'-nucleotidase SurE [Sulfobacillus sp. hq2]|uniref:5'/3'-nucleotidase SurE n=1 Tax=Sulfobacillus TaxID=28033 RepID=UPI000CD14348|nr:5'/3'-nucleotidase SurE [Sulfobacillus sp. hq2]POB10919.1 5'/3'-nucleotidase SurE [Sulfobacillus sp. hq2]